VIDLYDELSGIIDDFSRRGIDYALCGGLALAAHGIPRATMDIDLLVPPESLENARAHLRGRGYVLEGAEMDFASGAVRITRLTRPDPESEDFLTVDLLEVTPALRGVWEQRQSVEWEGGTLTTVSRQGLVDLKRLRGSGQDRDDIEKLMEP
jgi:hypothetical protein